MTVLEVLQSTTDYFKKRTIESPRLNAEHLLAHVLGRKRLDLYLEFERVLTEAELIPLREAVKRRGQGEPLQHLLGTVEFCGQTFLCDKRALVPRHETEELVECVKSKIEADRREATTQSGKQISPASVRERNRTCKILDVGTGSGVIALSLAAEMPEASVQAVDISDDALSLARENAERLGLSARIQFVKADLLDGVNGPFDAIVANLPYIPEQERASLSREVLHDPAVALFGGDSGDELIRRLIDQAPDRLRAGGLLALEIGVAQSEPLASLLARKNYHDIESKNDYSDVARFLFARYG
jgi:release factor glutamine methyltransferase